MESPSPVEIDTGHAVLALVKSATGHIGVTVLINAGQVEPKQERELRLWLNLVEDHVRLLYQRHARATQTTVRIRELPQAKVALVNRDIEERVVRKVS